MAQHRSDLTLSIDDDLKARGEALFSSLGMNFSAAVNAFVRKSIKEGKIPFEIDDALEPHDFAYCKELEEQDPYFDRAEQADIRRAAAEAEEGKVVRFDPIRETAAIARARLSE